MKQRDVIITMVSGYIGFILSCKIYDKIQYNRVMRDNDYMRKQYGKQFDWNKFTYERFEP